MGLANKPDILVSPGTGACVDGAVSFTVSSMPEGTVTLRMIFPGASGWNDAPLGVATANATGNWSLTTTVPTENTNHWQNEVTLEQTYSGYGDFNWIVTAVGSDGISASRGSLTVLNCQAGS